MLSRMFFLNIVFSLPLLAVSDPFSNAKENSEKVEVVAIAINNNKRFACLKINNENFNVTTADKINDWLVKSIEKNQVELEYLPSRTSHVFKM